MTGKPGTEDLRYATDRERRYALAYLRWLAHRRATEPRPTHAALGLTQERGDAIRADVDRMVRDASAETEREG